MRKILVFGFAMFVLSACSEAQPKASVEEQVLMKIFVSYQGALVFDQECNKREPKERYDTSKKENINLLGNEQMLAARLGGLQHVRFPKASVDDLVKKLRQVADKISSRARTVLKEKGCDSPESQSLQKAFALFTQAHPAFVYSMIDKEIIKQGGTITSLEEIEAVGKPSEAVSKGHE